MIVRSVGRSVAEERARVITALPTTKVLSTPRQMVASQIVLIILGPKPERPLSILTYDLGCRRPL
jgi:hypothetical protein